MRVWIYARLSNDDDQEMNSLLNQQEICHGFAEQHGYTIVGQSSDDNVSGMKFNRRGLDELTAAVDADKIDAVIVKGIVSLLIQVLSGHTPQEILDADLYFIEQIGLKEHLSPTRSNGLLAMVKQMHLYAVAFRAREKEEGK